MEPHYCIDESLSLSIARVLHQSKFPIHRIDAGDPDPKIISDVGNRYGSFGVWVTCDMSSKQDHREDILSAGISVAWVQASEASAATRLFLSYSFMYRYHSVIADSSVPLYFDVRERLTKDIPSAVVKKITL